MDHVRDALTARIVTLAPSMAPYLHLDTTEQLRDLLTGMEQQRQDFADMGFIDAASHAAG